MAITIKNQMHKAVQVGIKIILVDLIIQPTQILMNTIKKYIMI